MSGGKKYQLPVCPATYTPSDFKQRHTPNREGHGQNTKAGFCVK